MGNRLTKIYTRTGDKGSTGLSNGSRVSKDHIRIAAIGTIDELNSTLGLIVCGDLDDSTRELIINIQHKLFNIGGELSLPGYNLINDSHVTWLENRLDELNGDLPPLKDFILPGGSQAAAYCHLARSICRRAERELVTLKNQKEEIAEPVLQYVNRLSDFLFVLARHINKQQNQPDIIWDASKKD